MQPQDSVSVSRRTLDVEDYIDIVRRHKAWIFGPVFAALVVSVVVAFLWPDTYVSAATIRVVPPQVPESYVPANISMDIQGRVNSMTQVILSRNTLTNIINTQGLYKKEIARMPIDDVIEAMRSHDIHVFAIPQSLNQGPGRAQYPAFMISFSYNNRFMAQKVTTDLVARFLEENQREMSQNTSSTSQFLRDSWEVAKQKLDEIEQKLSTFRTRNLGRLPEEQQANYQQLNATQVQMLNLNTSMTRINGEKLLLENQLRLYKEQLSSMKDPSQSDQAMQQKNEKLAEKDREIAHIEAYLANLRDHYRDTYPDVQNAIVMLASAKKQREVLVQEEANKKPEPVQAKAASPQFVRETRDLESAIKRIQAVIETKDLEMQDYQKQATSLSESVKNIQARLEGLPVGIKEYDELIRERELAKREYENLDRSVTASELSNKLQNRQQGERLEQLDQPSLPTTSETKRPVIIAVGTGLGLVMGLFLAGAREVKDTSLKNLKDVRAYTQLPILGSIPLLENDLVVRRRKRLGWLAWSTACLVGLVVMSSSVVYYYATKL